MSKTAEQLRDDAHDRGRSTAAGMIEQLDKVIAEKQRAGDDTSGLLAIRADLQAGLDEAERKHRG